MPLRNIETFTAVLFVSASTSIRSIVYLLLAPIIPFALQRLTLSCNAVKHTSISAQKTVQLVSLSILIHFAIVCGNSFSIHKQISYRKYSCTLKHQFVVFIKYSGTLLHVNFLLISNFFDHYKRRQKHVNINLLKYIKYCMLHYRNRFCI